MAVKIINNSWVIYDLEFVGDIREGVHDCHCWSIGAVKPNGATFEAFINVPTEKKTHPGCVHVTKAFLKSKGAVPFDIAFTKFKQWVGPQAVLMSHNNFKSDKLVLERECSKHHVHMPHWYFFDTLLYLRSSVQSPSYKLPDIYKHILKRDFVETHTALKDAMGLWDIIRMLPPSTGYMYPKYLTSLQNVKWLGASCEKCLVERGIRCVEHLIINFMMWIQVDTCKIASMKQFLIQFNMPVHDLTPIATELVDNWLPKTYGGLSWSTLL